MNVENFAEWLRRQNHHVVKTESSYWYDAGPRVYQAFPYGWVIKPTEQELNKMMTRHGAVALRYSTPFNEPEGLVSYHVILHAPYSLDLLDHRARNGVKRGLKGCRVEPIPMARLADEGWELQKDTLERQNRLDSMSRADWELICHSAENLPGFEAWGAIIGDELVASILTTRIDDTYYVPYAQCNHLYLGYHVNNALFYEASCSMLSRDGVNGIFFSLHSLDAPESTNEFKFRMNFIARPVRQRIAFHPVVAPLANKASHRIVQRLMMKYPSSSLLAKTEGILRFYVEGKRSCEEQYWPKCLNAFKEAVLGPEVVKEPERIEQVAV